MTVIFLQFFKSRFITTRPNILQFWQHNGIGNKIYSNSGLYVNLFVRFSTINSRYQWKNATTCIVIPNRSINKFYRINSNMIGNGYQEDEFARSIRDLNSLQSNSQVLALAKYKQPETILPLFRQQLKLAGIDVGDLNRLNIIHVSGTKGKGSTCAFLEQILAKSDKIKLKIGSYNSPHLVSITERIRIDGRPIDRKLFSKYFRHIYDKLKIGTKDENITMPSYFSFLTILAFHIFLEEQIDCSIVEVGMGGEYDPTNIIQRPLACAITTLDLDHTNILGKTIEQIAWTKAGIMKPATPLFTIDHKQKEAMEMIQTRAREKQSPVYICKPLDVHNNSVVLGIKGSAQYINASIACQLAAYSLAKFVQDKFKVDNLLQRPVDKNSNLPPVELATNLNDLPEFFRIGLERCRLPGRCQIIKVQGIVFYLDGAHTRKSMENCLEWFIGETKSYDEGAEQILMVNVIGDRDKGEILKPLMKHHSFNHVIFTTNKIYPSENDTASSEKFVRAQDVNNEKGLENARTNTRVWQHLTEQYLYNNKDSSLTPKITTNSSIIESLVLIDGYKKSISSNTLDPRLSNLHVLVTGSLHFVGAVLEAISTFHSKDLDVD